MLVFAAHPSERLKYILDQVLRNYLGISYKITDNPDYFRKSPSLKINYDTHIVEGCVNIPSVPLLFEDSISEHKVVVHKSKKWLYEVFHHPYENLPDFKIHTTYLSFDLLAASFYLMTRYEEYLPGIRDQHNRYRPEDSLAFKHGFMDIPLVDHWVQRLEETLKNQYPELTFQEHRYRQINTIDVDFAYKYKGQNFFALTRKFAGSLWRGNPDYHCLIHPKQDPYDRYDWMTAQAEAKNIESRFFLLLADYGGLDKNISPLSDEMKELSKRLSKKYVCGIHPSYRAAFNYKLYASEHKVFETLMGSRSTISRNHFLKIKLPESYRVMEEFGVEEDYTMAYSTCTGFRASTSFPYQFFDLHKNTTRQVLVYAPCVMDVVLKNILKLNPEESIAKIRQLKEEVKKVNGTFVSIWHNSNFDSSQGWTGWEQVYQSLFE